VILASAGTDSLVYEAGQDRQVFADRVNLDTGEVAAVTVNLIDCRRRRQTASAHDERQIR
jgi:hypothetical protein